MRRDLRRKLTLQTLHVRIGMRPGQHPERRTDPGQFFTGNLKRQDRVLKSCRVLCTGYRIDLSAVGRECLLKRILIVIGRNGGERRQAKRSRPVL